LPKREVVGTFGGNTIVNSDSAGRIEDLDHYAADEHDDDLTFEDNFDEFGVVRPIATDE